jgi:hypothetical protein
MAKERWPSLMLSPAGLSTKESRFDSRGSLELSFTPFCSPQLRLASFTGWLSRRWCGVVWSRTDPEYLMRTIALVAAELLGLARSPLSSFFFLPSKKEEKQCILSVSSLERMDQEEKNQHYCHATIWQSRSTWNVSSCGRPWVYNRRIASFAHKSTGTGQGRGLQGPN